MCDIINNKNSYDVSKIPSSDVFGNPNPNTTTQMLCGDGSFMHNIGGFQQGGTDGNTINTIRGFCRNACLPGSKSSKIGIVGTETGDQFNAACYSGFNAVGGSYDKNGVNKLNFKCSNIKQNNPTVGKNKIGDEEFNFKCPEYGYVLGGFVAGQNDSGSVNSLKFACVPKSNKSKANCCSGKNKESECGEWVKYSALCDNFSSDFCRKPENSSSYPELCEYPVTGSNKINCCLADANKTMCGDWKPQSQKCSDFSLSYCLLDTADKDFCKTPQMVYGVISSVPIIERSNNNQVDTWVNPDVISAEATDWNANKPAGDDSWNAGYVVGETVPINWDLYNDTDNWQAQPVSSEYSEKEDHYLTIMLIIASIILALLIVCGSLYKLGILDKVSHTFKEITSSKKL